MGYVALGLTGFLMGALYDLLPFEKAPKMRRALGMATGGALGASLALGLTGFLMGALYDLLPFEKAPKMRRALGMATGGALGASLALGLTGFLMGALYDLLPFEKAPKMRRALGMATGGALGASLALGLTGFLMGALYDLLPFEKAPKMRRALGMATGGALGASLALVCLTGNPIDLPAWTGWLGRALLPVTALLLAYSLFWELPFKGTYLASGTGPRLVRTGTYALVRHPGVVWYALLLLALLLISRSSLLLIAAPVWVAADVLWVIAQEKFALSRTFPEYSSYQRETPMLIPTWRSLRMCLSTLRGAQA